MGCATGFAKYLVFIANLVFALIGLAMVIIGIVFQLNVKDATRVLPKDIGIAPILFIVVGSVIFFTAFMGCCGAVKESPCMLTTYAIILLTIFIVQVALAIYAFLYIKNEGEFRSLIRNSVEKTFNEAYTHRNVEAIQARDGLQRWVQCCGVEGPDEYGGNKPLSCCANDENGCPSTNNPFFYEGCSEKLYRFVAQQSKLVGGIAIGIAALEILGAIFGLCLASNVRNQYRRQMYS